MHECPCFQLVISLQVAFIWDVNLQIERVLALQSCCLLWYQSQASRLCSERKEKNLNYSERQGRKEERIHDFSELQPSNKYIKCVVLTCLRNYRKEIPEIFVLFCNSAEDERDVRIMVTIKQIYNWVFDL